MHACVRGVACVAVACGFFDFSVSGAVSVPAVRCVACAANERASESRGGGNAWGIIVR